MGMSDVKKRKASTLVRGKAELFSVCNNGKISKTWMTDRFCQSALAAVDIFIPNHNLHALPDQGRGTLIVVRDMTREF